MSQHQQVTQLLPWYVNGTLNEQEMATVAAHLEHCADCREAVEVDLGDARRLHAGTDEARVAALVARRGREFQALQHRLVGLRAPRRHVPSRAVTVVAAALVIGIAVPVAWLARTPEPTIYELRTDAVAPETPILQLVFRDGTSAEDVELLIRTSGTPLGPPTAHGIYRIALATRDPVALLHRIRAHPAVRWAEIEL